MGLAHGAVTTRTKAEPHPFISGFCNPTLPRTAAYDPHQRCHGCDCTAPNCHQEPTMPDPFTTGPEYPPSPAIDQARAEGWLTGDGTAKAPYVVGSPPPTAAAEGSPEAAVAAVRDAADALNTALLGYHPGDWRDALYLLRDLRAATRVLTQLDASLVSWTYLHGEHGKQVIDGLGEVWVSRGRSKERWAGPEAINEYVDTKITGTGGELPDPRQVVEWVLEVLPATPSTSLRVTPLREAGLDPEDFRTSEPGNLSVTLPPPPA